MDKYNVNIPLGILKKWQKLGILDSVYPQGAIQGLATPEAAFELRLYLELHLLGYTEAALQRVSGYLRTCGMEMSAANIDDKSFVPTGIERIMRMVKDGDTCFLLFDLAGTMRIFEDEMLFMSFMKRGFGIDEPAHTIISANKILDRIGVGVKRRRASFIKNTLKKELELRFDGVKQVIVNHNPNTVRVHKLLKKPNKTVIAYTDGNGEITAVHEVCNLSNFPETKSRAETGE